MNESELLFESILNNLNVKFKKIPESKIRTPDYEIVLDGISTYWEIKHTEENEIERSVIKSVDSGEVVVNSVSSDRVEYSIKNACDQFKKYKVTDKPCIIVLIDQRDFLVRDFLFINAVQNKMVGRGHYIEGEDGYYECFRENGLLTNRKKYVSAIAVMNKYNKSITFIHNPNASISLLSGEVRKFFSTHFCAVRGKKGLEWVQV